MTDLSDLAQLIADAFSLGAVAAPLRVVDRGEQARVWRLTTERGEYAVKEPLRGFEARSDGIDIAFQEAILAQTDVLLPVPVRRPDGAAVANVGGADLRVTTWVDMRSISKDIDPEQLGRTLALLHRVDFASPADVDPWYFEPVGRAAFERYADLLAGAGAPFAPALAAAVPGLIALEELLETPRDHRMCHRDLWANNVRATPDGTLCVFDWDNCGTADPSHELAMVVYEFAYLDASRCHAIHSAYVDAGGPARLTRPGQLTMVIAQFGHFWEHGAREWLRPDTTPEERAHLCDWLLELDDQPLRVDVCEQIIAAVGA